MPAERFAVGDAVRARSVDPPGHTRLPGYVRGARGVIAGVAGHHPLADARARGHHVAPEPVYHVGFPAREVFGSGDHTIIVELWESYLDLDTAPETQEGRPA